MTYPCLMRNWNNLLYVASHDLQEPLRMISSFISLLGRKYGERLDEKGMQYIHFAVDGASRMRQIILDLLTYSRVGKNLEENPRIQVAFLLDEGTAPIPEADPGDKKQ